MRKEVHILCPGGIYYLADDSTKINHKGLDVPPCTNGFYYFRNVYKSMIQYVSTDTICLKMKKKKVLRLL